MTLETAAVGTTPAPEPHHDDHEPAADRAHPTEPVGSARPLVLDRLLSVAVLTPAQASLVAVQLLDAADRGDSAAGESPVGACLGAVTLTPAGIVEVSSPQAGAGTPLSEPLGQLLENARRLPVHPRPAQLLLLRRLEDAATEPVLAPGARARALEDALADALGPRARQRLTGQLAALVEAFAHVAPGVPARPDADTAPAAPAARASSRRGSSSRQGPQRAAPARAASKHPRRRRALLRPRAKGRVAFLAFVLVAGLALSGYVVLGGPGSTIVGSLGRDRNPGAPDTTGPDQPATQPTTEPAQAKDRVRTVASLAPRRAGPITGVTLQKTGGCSPGALCPVTVTVHFRPTATTRSIGWRVGAAPACTRRVTWSSPVTVTAQPGWTTVYASSSVRVPKGRPVALVALTTTPDRAQSRPVPVTGSSQRC